MATLDALKGWAGDTVLGATPGATGAAAAIPTDVGVVALKAETQDAEASNAADAAAAGAGGDGGGADAMDVDEKDDGDGDADKPKGGKEKPGGAGGKVKPGEEKGGDGDANDANDASAEPKDDGAAEKSKSTGTGGDASGKASRAADAPDSDAKPAVPDPDAPDPNRPGSLSAKETVLFLSKLAHLTRLGREVTQTAEWEEKLLGTLHALCASGGAHAMALRQEVFVKVERNHLLGLRTRHPEAPREKFFALYHAAVGQRRCSTGLQFVLAGQEWDAMADTFWLKQGLDLILSTLAEDERVTLAPNSAQRPVAPSRARRARRRDSRRREARARGCSDPKSGGPPPPPPHAAARRAGRAETPQRKDQAALLDRHAAFLHRRSRRLCACATSVASAARGGDAATRTSRTTSGSSCFPIVWATLQARGADARSPSP